MPGHCSLSTMQCFFTTDLLESNHDLVRVLEPRIAEKLKIKYCISPAEKLKSFLVIQLSWNWG